MKKKILSVLFIGVIAMASMGFRTSSAGSDSSGLSGVQAVKVGVTYDASGNFDAAAFYLTGFRPGQHVVTEVVVLDKHGDMVGSILMPEGVIVKGNFMFTIDLKNCNIGQNKEFSLEIHVYNKRLLDSTIVLAAAGMSTDPAPIEPDETILIVRYP